MTRLYRAIIRQRGLCNESPCSNRQVPYCFDQCPEADTHGTDTTPMHACQIHPASVPGNHSWIIAPPCNDDTHCMYACQTNSDHSMVVGSCYSTNTNGDRCTVTNYYVCQYHTHAYPAPSPPPPTPVTCGQCSVSYNPQGSRAWRHELIPCPRTRTEHGLVCGGSFYRCSNTNTCIWGWRHSSRNDDPNP